MNENECVSYLKNKFFKKLWVLKNQDESSRVKIKKKMIKNNFLSHLLSNLFSLFIIINTCTFVIKMTFETLLQDYLL